MKNSYYLFIALLTLGLLGISSAFTMPPHTLPRLIEVTSCNFTAETPNAIYVQNKLLACLPSEFGIRFEPASRGSYYLVKKNAGFLGMPRMGTCVEVLAENINIKGFGLEGLSWWNCAGVGDGLVADGARNLIVRDFEIAGARGDALRMTNTTANLLNVTTH